MKTCWRCGVSFDAADYLPEAPCLDCQEWVDEPIEGWLVPRALKDRQAEEFTRRTDLIIRKLHKQGYNDSQIGKQVGYSESWVQLYRQKLDLDAGPGIQHKNDPIILDQRKKLRAAMQKYDYTTRSYVYKDDVTRKENVANRLLYGWPEERAYWQEKDMQEAKERTVKHYLEHSQF